jgi:hypothetical protein
MREAILLSIAVRGFGGSYVRELDKAKSKAERKKYNGYIDKCLRIALRLELVFSMMSVVHEDGSESPLGGSKKSTEKVDTVSES